MKTFKLSQTLTNVCQVIILAMTKLIVKMLMEVFNASARMDILGMDDFANVSRNNGKFLLQCNIDCTPDISPLHYS